MKILSCRPIAHVDGGRSAMFAVCDVEVVDGLKITGLNLALAPDGGKFVFGPEARGQRFLRFSGDYPRQLADAAWQAMGGGVANVGQ